MTAVNNFNKIAVIGAMQCEIDEIKNILTDLKEVAYGDLKIFTGTAKGTQKNSKNKELTERSPIEDFGDDNKTRIFQSSSNNKFVILAQSGIGKVNAAINTQYIIDTFKPEIIINTGVAGGLAKGLKIGDIVLAESLIQHDFDVTFLGYAKGFLFVGDDKTEPTKFYADKNTVTVFENIINKNMSGVSVHKGIVASGDIFVSDKKQKEDIFSQFGAIAVEMEGGAIAQTAFRNNIPFVVIRGISDLADGTEGEYRVNVEDIAKLTATTVKLWLKG